MKGRTVLPSAQETIALRPIHRTPASWLLALTLLGPAGLQASDEPAATATTAGAVETRLLVRALSRDAKLMGDAVGGVRISVTDAATGALLASGVTQGDTGSTDAIMGARRGASTDVFASPGAAGWEARFPLAVPTLVQISAEGPLAYPQATSRASKTLLLTPGAEIGGGGVVLELHGFIVELLGMRPAPNGSLLLEARVRMLCSCPTAPGGLWSAGEVTAQLRNDAGEVATVPLAYAGSDSRYAGMVPRPDPGRYRLVILAADAATGNFGQLVGQLEVGDGESVMIVAPAG